MLNLLLAFTLSAFFNRFSERNEIDRALTLIATTISRTASEGNYRLAFEQLENSLKSNKIDATGIEIVDELSREKLYIRGKIEGSCEIRSRGNWYANTFFSSLHCVPITQAITLTVRVSTASSLLFNQTSLFVVGLALTASLISTLLLLRLLRFHRRRTLENLNRLLMKRDFRADSSLPSADLGELEEPLLKIEETITSLEETAKSVAKDRAIAKTVQMLAHDVRKPFSILKLLLDSLRTPMGQEERSTFLSQGIQEVDSSIATVNGLLEDLMSVGAKDSTLSHEALHVSEIVELSLKELSRVFPQAMIKIKVSSCEHSTVNVDLQKILRVFSNVILNAIQAMEQNGRIEILSKRRDDTVQVSIRNYGSHIDSDKRKQIFDTFFTSGKKGGTGLGLAIAKKWVEAHGGKIACHSHKESDSLDSWVAFEFTLPFARHVLSTSAVSKECSLAEFVPQLLSRHGSSAPTGDPAGAYEEEIEEAKRLCSSVSSPRVIILEDEKPYAEGLRLRYQRLFGTSEGFVWTSKVEEFEDRLRNDTPELVILDIDLEGQSPDGLEALRKNESLLAGKCVCVHSNRADAETSSRALALGASFVFPKPMSISHFARLVEDVGKRRKERKKLGQKNRVRVAIVEDGLIFRLAWKERLKDGAQVLLFSKSSEFLDKTAPDDVDAVITDFHLGADEPNGSEVQKRLKKAGFKGPIILCSELQESETDLSGFDHITNKTDLMSVEELQELVERKS